MAAALALRGVTKQFGAVRALDGAELTVRRGTVHALLGENGAGKTTLMRVCYGMVRPDSGRVERDGKPIRLRSPADAIGAGIGMVHQHFTHVGALTVAENVALGGRGFYAASRADALVREVSARAGLSLDPEARVESLGVGAQQRLEIVKALARGADLLILDEPTAVLAPAEISDLLRWLRAFVDDGNTAILITHKLREALAVADDVTVLRRGRTVLTAAAGDVSATGLADAMIGRISLATAPEVMPGGINKPGEVVWRAAGASVVGEDGIARLRDATLEVRGGEILGVAGVEGSGAHELLQLAAGRVRAAAGEVSALSDVGFIPEDRHAEALVLELSLAENVALRGAGQRRGLMRWDAFRARTRALAESHGVRPADPTLPARALSGGNQQKLVLAREMAGRPPLIVAENPTRGLDLHATRAVHAALRDAALAGSAVIVHSADIDEVLDLATRLVVVHAARVRDVPLDRDAAGRAMLGVE